MLRLPVGISSCLLGERVRYDGAHRWAPVLLKRLGPRVEWVPFCPEVEAGMGVPREPVRLVGGDGAGDSCGSLGPRMLGVRSGRDWSEALRGVAASRVEQLRALGICGYVLKSRSPSCGMSVPVEAAQGTHPPRAGLGLFAAVLRQEMPELPIAEDGELEVEANCRLFLAAVETYQRARSTTRDRGPSGASE